MTDPSSFAPFPSSRWTQIVRAGQGAPQALEELAARYWKPIYAFIRRSGWPQAASEDLTQDFFLFLLENRVLGKADPNRGRFRGFVRACLRNFLANAHDRRRAAMRGGDHKVFSLDSEGAERALGVAAAATPEALFDRLWAMETLERAVKRLREWMSPEAREIYALACGQPPVPHREIAARLGTSEDAVAQSVARTKKKLREFLVEEVRDTVEEGADYHGELSALLEALAAAGTALPPL